jgi:phosphoribosylformylglycinamidine synthase subunit PurQ / glutaminase
MATPKICVLRAPGTNCDIETAHAFELAGGAAERLHLFRLLEDPQRLSDFQILCIPGGFSYGDDVGAGVVFGSQLRGHLNEAIDRFLQADKLVLGICNGFQVLMKSGILPGGESGGREAAQATLTWNENGQYTALWSTLNVASPNNVFLRGLERLELPVAHAEGRVAVKDPAVIDQWRQSGQLALQYASPNGGTAVTDVVLPYPHNPNGSIANIAGLGDPTGRVLGLMPHPERFLYATQHPQWTRRRMTGEGAGLKLFRNAVEYFA